MNAYTPGIERMMKRLFDSLRENDRRRYAAIEATKLGHGGVEYIARVLGCDPKTIRQGQTELEEGDDLDTERVRKSVFAPGGSGSDTSTTTSEGSPWWPAPGWLWGLVVLAALCVAATVSVMPRSASAVAARVGG